MKYEMKHPSDTGWHFNQGDRAVWPSALPVRSWLIVLQFEMSVHYVYTQFLEIHVFVHRCSVFLVVECHDPLTKRMAK